MEILHCQYEDSFPWRLKHCWNPLWGSWNDWIGFCLRGFTAGDPVTSPVWVKNIRVLKWVKIIHNMRVLKGVNLWHFAMWVNLRVLKEVQFWWKRLTHVSDCVSCLSFCGRLNFVGCYGWCFLDECSKSWCHLFVYILGSDDLMFWCHVVLCIGTH